jgi:endonuclease/exonuclease/phosphatase family metal-dependent hydrolase
MLISKRTFAPVLAVATVLSGTALLQGTDQPSASAPDHDARTHISLASALVKPDADEFRMATFNVLGTSHTRRSGRSEAARSSAAMRYVNKHGVSAVGLQELERTQYAAFLRAGQGDWAAVGAPSRSGKSTDTRNSIAYKKSRFTLVSHSSLGIPYFHGKQVNIPVVKLKSRKTGETFVMINTHNAADTQGPAQRYRNEATRREVAIVKRLRAQGATVFVTGDMNEKRPYFCKMTRSGDMQAASGGSRGARCSPPRVNGIDWIFGSGDATFSNWTSDRSTRASGVSDHPIVVAKVTLPR